MSRKIPTGTVMAIGRARARQVHPWACPTKGCRYVLTAPAPPMVD